MRILLELVLQLFQRHLQILLGARQGGEGGGGGDSWVLKKQLVTKGEKSENRPFSGRSKSLSITHCMHLQREKEECSPRTVCFLSTRDAMLSTYCKLA